MKIRFIGGGAMATAIIAGMTQNHEDCDISVIEPLAQARTCLYGRFQDAVSVFASWSDAPEVTADNTRLIVLAVKPQQVKEAIQPLLSLASPLPSMLSIVAGVRAETLSRLLGGAPSIIRAMPNTPALIGKGLTALYASPSVDVETRALVGKLMAQLGDVKWFNDQAMIDVMTALTGSGPGYVYYFMECIENAARSFGITPDGARQVALSITESAAQLAQRESKTFAELRAQVTSKGGTTEAAICVLDQSNVKGAFFAAVTEAHRRA
ncbi:MAG: pyrroline-5-carboxylate reductase, partial [Burkholderiales bacterium]|nr:pyrroline-5-carboxylate reductase [Burkholderiales bacterium]